MQQALPATQKVFFKKLCESLLKLSFQNREARSVVELKSFSSPRDLDRLPCGCATDDLECLAINDDADLQTRCKDNPEVSRVQLFKGINAAAPSLH